MTTCKYIKEPDKNQKFSFYITELLLDSTYVMVCDTKGLETMDGIK